MSEPLTPEEETALRKRHRDYGHVAFKNDECDVDRLFATLDAARLSHDRGADAVTVITRDKPHDHDIDRCHDCYALTRRSVPAPTLPAYTWHRSDCPFYGQPEGELPDDRCVCPRHQAAPTLPALVSAAQAVIDQWTETFGPDGYANQMPANLRVLREALRDAVPLTPPKEG